MSKYHIGKIVTFIEEPETPYVVMVKDERWVVLTRSLTQEDADHYGLIEDWGKFVIYTIIDLEQQIRGSHNLVFNFFEFENVDGCRQCLADLQTGDIEISHRNRVDLNIVSQPIRTYDD